MQNQRPKQNEKTNLDNKMTILANLILDRIIEEHEKALKYKHKTTTISSGASKQ